MNKAAKYGGIAAGITIGLAAMVDRTIDRTLAVEQGYVNNPRDPGGETNHGITIAVARANNYLGSMKDLPKEKAQEIYFNDYIYKPGYLPILERSPALGEKLIDIGVNAGTRRASCWFQQALNDLSRGGRDYAQITIDCKVGNQTYRAYDSLVAKRGRVKACELTLKLIENSQASHYRSLSIKDEFLVGWVDHRVGNVTPEQCKEVIT